MPDDRSRYGLLVSALGAVLLAVSVFLPWYGLSFTNAGLALAQQVGDEFARQFGNASLQSTLTGAHAQLAGLAGHEFISLSAHQVLHNMNVVLLALAAFALLDALVPLVRSGAPLPEGAGRAVVLLGLVAGLCVVYRMVHPPIPTGGVVALSLREGSWLALLGSVMVALGGVWPRSVMLRMAVEADDTAANPFTALSGWTPGS